MKKVNERFLVLLLTIISMNLLQAQDIITKRTGEDIKAKILEVGINEIKYKNFDNQNGPTYSLLKNDILIIRYENGTKDLFNQNNTKNNVLINESETKKDEIISKEIQNKNEDLTKNSKYKGKKKYFGIKGGVNYANLTAGDNKAIIGFNVGCFFEHKFSKLFSIQPEVQFSEQGFKLTYQLRQNFDDPITSQSLLTILDYVNVPILAKYNINENVNLFVGPQIGYLIGAKIGSQNAKDVFNSIDFGIDFGSEIILNNIVIDLRYNLGLYEVLKKTAFNTSNKNSVFQLSLGYKF